MRPLIVQVQTKCEKLIGFWCLIVFVKKWININIISLVSYLNEANKKKQNLQNEVFAVVCVSFVSVCVDCRQSIKSRAHNKTILNSKQLNASQTMNNNMYNNRYIAVDDDFHFGNLHHFFSSTSTSTSHRVQWSRRQNFMSK